MGLFDGLKDFFRGTDGTAAPTGGDGTQYAAPQNETANSNLQNMLTANQSPQAAAALQAYSSGQMSLPDLQKTLSSTLLGGNANAIMSDPVAANKLVTSLTQGDPTQAQLSGPGGMLSQAAGNYGTATSNLAGDRNALSGRDPSYGLQQSDLAAYGQESGNIGRMFGNQGNNLAQSLADRGLSSGASGSAQAQFSGLYGNQNEQLAGLQNQIAQQRIQTAQGLAQQRNASDLAQQQGAGTLGTNLGNQYQSALGNTFGRANTATDNSYNQAMGGAEASQANQALQQGIQNNQFAQAQDTKTPGLFGAIGQGLTQGIGSSVSGIAGAPGTAATSLAKSFGKGANPTTESTK